MNRHAWRLMQRIHPLSTQTEKFGKKCFEIFSTLFAQILYSADKNVFLSHIFPLNFPVFIFWSPIVSPLIFLHILQASWYTLLCQYRFHCIIIAGSEKMFTYVQCMGFYPGISAVSLCVEKEYHEWLICIHWLWINSRTLNLSCCSLTVLDSVFSLHMDWTVFDEEYHRTRNSCFSPFALCWWAFLVEPGTETRCGKLELVFLSKLVSCPCHMFCVENFMKKQNRWTSGLLLCIIISYPCMHACMYNKPRSIKLFLGHRCYF